MEEKKIYQEIPAGRNTFHSAILTTYSFNFHHFEYQVLKTLKHKSIYNIGVLVDAYMLDQTLGVSSAGLKQMTQTYSINGVHAKGAFHPKINFLIGDQHLMLVLGSGNITAGGHGKNHETFTTIYADTTDSLLLPILNEGWFYLQNISKKLNGFSRNRIQQSITKNCELISSPPKKLHQFYAVDDDIDLALIYNDETSILNQITSLIPSDPINSITIVCPYYDEDGELLLTLLDKYPRANLNIFLPNEQGLPPLRIAKTNRISFYKWENTNRGKKEIKSSEGYKRKLHSKLFVFHADTYEYCMLGSANATTAAFGTVTRRGINEEFGILYKSNKIDFLAELGIDGKKENANLSQLHRDAWVTHSAPVSIRTHKTIKIESCDLDGLTIKCFCSFSVKLDNIYLCIYNDVSEELSITETKISLDLVIIIRLNSKIAQDNLAYVLVKDENNNVISNKQVINNTDRLFNTYPSKENRAIRSLRSALEIGKINEYELLGYFNELNERVSKPKVIKATAAEQSIEEKSEAHSEMTFEEAMLASKNKTYNEQLSTKHNAVQFWQTITSLLKEKQDNVSDVLDDEEEDADATKSKERKTDNTEEHIFKIKDDAEINRILHKTEQLTNYFVSSMDKLARDKDLEINEVVVCQFLLISHIITAILQFNTYELPYDEEKKKFKVYTPKQWKKILCDKYYFLMRQVLISFSKMILSHSILEFDDEYRAKKFNSFLQEVTSYIFIYHYLIDRSAPANTPTEMIDLACLNIVFKLGFPNDDFIKIIERISKSKEEVLFKAFGAVQLKKRIEKLFKKIESKDEYFKHLNDSFGICLVKENDGRTIYYKSILDKNQMFRMNIKEWKKLYR